MTLTELTVSTADDVSPPELLPFSSPKDRLSLISLVQLSMGHHIGGGFHFVKSFLSPILLLLNVIKNIMILGLFVMTFPSPHGMTKVVCMTDDCGTHL